MGTRDKETSHTYSDEIIVEASKVSRMSLCLAECAVKDRSLKQLSCATLREPRNSVVRVGAKLVETGFLVFVSVSQLYRCTNSTLYTLSVYLHMWFSTSTESSL